MGPRDKLLLAFKERTAGREDMLLAILDFVKSFVSKHGTRPRLEGRGSTVRLVRELDDFNKLYFVWSASRIPVAKDNILISYGPSQDKRRVVFSADYWEDIKEWQIHFFSEDLDWQEAFAFVLSHKDKFMVKLRAKQSREKIKIALSRFKIAAHRR